MGDIIHQGGQYSLVNNVRGDNFWGGQYSLVNNVRGDNFWGGQYSQLHRCHREYGIPGDLASWSKIPYRDFDIPRGEFGIPVFLTAGMNKHKSK